LKAVKQIAIVCQNPQAGHFSRRVWGKIN